MQKFVIFVNENLKIDVWKINNIVKLHIIVIIQENIEVPKSLPIVFHNGSNYDYHFIIKDLAEEFKKQCTWWRRTYWKIYNLYSSNKRRSYKNW